MNESDYGKVQSMIDRSLKEALRKHNRNASFISASLGVVVLAFYSHGLVKVVESMR
jgi:hypothetical protein